MRLRRPERRAEAASRGEHQDENDEGEIGLDPLELAGGGHHVGGRGFAGGERGGEGIATGEGGGDGQSGGGAAGGIGVEAAEDDALDGGVEVLDDRGGAGRRGLCLEAGQLGDARGLEGALASEHFVEHDAEAVDVAAGGDLGAFELLGGHVSGRAAANLGALDLAGPAGEPEIHDADLAAAIDHDVGGLEVAVEHALLVRGGETGADAAREFEGLVGGKAADAAEQRGEILAVDELHGDVVEALVDADVVNAADVGVRDLAGDADFVEKTLEDGLGGADGFGQELERDGLAEDQVGGAVDLAHAAAAELAGDAVAGGNQGAGREALLVGMRGGGRLGRRHEFGRRGLGGLGERGSTGAAKAAGRGDLGGAGGTGDGGRVRHGDSVAERPAGGPAAGGVPMVRCGPPRIMCPRCLLNDRSVLAPDAYRHHWIEKRSFDS